MNTVYIVEKVIHTEDGYTKCPCYASIVPEMAIDMACYMLEKDHGHILYITKIALDTLYKDNVEPIYIIKWEDGNIYINDYAYKEAK